MKRKKAFLFIIVTSVILLALPWLIERNGTEKRKDDFTALYVRCEDIPSLRVRPCLAENTDNEEMIYFFLPFRQKDYIWDVPSDITLYVDGNICRFGDRLSATDPEKEYLLAVEKDGVFVDARYLKCMQAEQMPALSIAIDKAGFEEILNDRDHLTVEKASIIFVNEEGEEEVYADCEFGGRGNSTWLKDKKSFGIKFESLISMAGMGKYTKWVLLANGMDHSNIKNKIVYEAARRTDLEYSVGCRYINLYINGIYQGLYLLTEDPGCNGGVVIFSDDLEDENHQLIPLPEYNSVIKDWKTKEEIRFYDILKSPPDISGSYLLEFDEYDEEMSDYSFDSWFRTNISTDIGDNQWLVDLQQPGIASEKEVLYIKDYVWQTEAALYSGDGVDPDSGVDFRDRIDMHSWAMSYLFMDFFANHDISAGSLFFYKKRNDPLLYSGPIWDYDKTMTDDFRDIEDFPWYGRATTYLWYERMNTFEEFHSEVEKNYRSQLSPALDEIISEELPVWMEEISSSEQMDEIKWSRGTGREIDRTNEVAAWVSKRKELFDKVWIEGESSEYAENIY